MTVTRLRHARHIVVRQTFIRLPGAQQPEIRRRVRVGAGQCSRWQGEAADQHYKDNANACAKKSRPVGHEPNLFRLEANSSLLTKIAIEGVFVSRGTAIE